MMRQSIYKAQRSASKSVNLNALMGKLPPSDNLDALQGVIKEIYATIKGSNLDNFMTTGWRVQERSNDSVYILELEVRFLGEWRSDGYGREDDDWEVITDKSEAEINAKLKPIIAKYPQYEIECCTHEKNWLSFDVLKRL